jgi:hypothetical protein
VGSPRASRKNASNVQMSASQPIPVNTVRTCIWSNKPPQHHQIESYQSPKGLAPTPIQPVSTRPRQALSIGTRLTLLAHLLRPSPSPAAQPVTSAYPSASGQATRLRGSLAYTWQPVVRLAVWCMTAMGCWEGVAIEIKTERESSGPELDPILPHWNWSFRWDDYLRIVCR